MWLLILIGIVLLIWVLGRSRAPKPRTLAKPSPERLRAATRRAEAWSAPIDQPHPKGQPTRWIPPGESIEIAGLIITGGMIYVGDALPVSGGGRNENCLIDPGLPISRRAPDRFGASMPYWPAYASIQPSARRAYLEWLANGRSDPAAYIGYVFLFFYGLERRLFLDRSNAELDALVAEVQRLRTLYGSNSSFSSYSATFLSAATLLHEPTPANFRDYLQRSYEIPLDVRRRLGARIAAREPLSADDALLWLLASPDTSLRTPATRCFDEFTQLWRARFVARFPNGLRVTPPKSRIRAQYRAASGTFVVDLPISDLPDISALSAPLKPLRAIADACTEDLAAYSRLLGRRPEAVGEIEAAVLLPPELLETDAGKPLMNAREQLEAHVHQDKIVAINLTALCSALGLATPAEERVPIAVERQICAILDRLDIGFEPDRRYGVAGLTPKGNIVLFKSDGGARVDADRPDYAAARSLVEIAALAAVADQRVVPEEIAAIQSDLESLPGITRVERTRLLAYTAALLGDPPKQQSAFNRLAKLGEIERRRITLSAISAVLADGRVTPSEVRFLEHLHKALGLPQDDVYAALHRGAVQIDAPTLVMDEQRSAGVAIPEERPKPVLPRSPIAIDEAKLKRVRRETTQVSALLASIFIEDAVSSSAAGAVRQVSAEYPGLDADHASLLVAVLSNQGLDRARFDESARSLGLLPEGAFETLNEWGFETFDEPILDDGDRILPFEHLRAKLESMGATQ